MIIPTLYPSAHKLRIDYPKRSRKQAEIFTVHSEEQARQLLHNRMRKYVTDKVYGYAKQRQHALAASMDLQQIYALSRIHHAFYQHYDCTLMGLAVKVTKIKSDLELIAPQERSRYYRHWKEVVMPVIEWCIDYVVRQRSGR